jgi:hypothetical protein
MVMIGYRYVKRMLPETELWQIFNAILGIICEDVYLIALAKEFSWERLMDISVSTS